MSPAGSTPGRRSAAVLRPVGEAAAELEQTPKLKPKLPLLRRERLFRIKTE